MDLRQLRYFVAAAEEGGIRKASYVLHVSQPPISVALRRLERELGTELLVRSRKGVHLTAAGTEFLVHARHILQATADAEEAMRRWSGGSS